ncbi:enoyl-CoA hydratase/carnithine racemase [Stella humosa]|uniref:Enoyl-CoA hydratase/carnithine racemase n=1 Tax=Stella humosa TaxID=94 RepID=A0A3N1L2W1_9PROT|nr:enoyl-CoA hydratase/isomerase family protein [Stella humosa]ROP83745.1 enoyl-CoA hydratase/carnithine racemase [Stella humosa]BBK32994.1 enoyl-CoA hydratase [Stella humosa]
MQHLEIADRVATLTLDRPPANAINAAWVAGFHARLDELAARDDWNLLHVRSALRLFSAGADLKDMRAQYGSPEGRAAFQVGVRAMQVLFQRIEDLPRPSLAEIGGHAMGGGFELALACTFRIAAHEIQLGLPEVRLGLLPGAGGTQRLTRLVGRAVAERLILGAETVDGATAERLGLVQWSAPLADLPAAAGAIARRLADLPPHAMAEARACIAAALDPAVDGFAREVSGGAALLETTETRALVARFLDRKG